MKGIKAFIRKLSEIKALCTPEFHRKLSENCYTIHRDLFIGN